jgi:hypothetical protein
MKTTLAMIVKNEQANLPACLESVRGLFDETVIVDTGSTDATVKIAKHAGARVLRFRWCDDFAAARNYGLDRIDADYVFRMDADDRLAPEHRKRTARILDGLDDVGPSVYMFRVTSMQHNNERAISDEPRLWPHCNEIRFHGRVHERIQPEKVKGITPEDLRGIQHRIADVRIDHSGYETQAQYLGKLVRNIRILEEMAREPECDPIVFFDLARTRAGIGGAHEQALAEFEQFLATMDVRHTVAGRVAHRRIVELLWELGRHQAAAIAADRGLRAYPDDQVICAATANMLEMCGEHELAREGLLMAKRLANTKRVEFGIATDFIRKIDIALAALPKTGAISISNNMVSVH